MLTLACRTMVVPRRCRYTPGHGRQHGGAGDVAKGIRAPLEERFWEKVERRGPDECWSWTAARTKAGYGQITECGEKFYAHRLSYEWAHGPIPDGHEVRPVCRNRACVNPSHLEAVTRAERITRGRGHGSETHCPAGHPYDEENTYRPARGGRMCRICSAENNRRRPPGPYDPAKRRLLYLRRQLRLRATAGFASVAAIQARWDYYGGCCWMCGATAAEVDHVKPLGGGGSNWPANLRPACVPCNRRKSMRWYGVAGLHLFRTVA